MAPQSPRAHRVHFPVTGLPEYTFVHNISISLLVYFSIMLVFSNIFSHFSIVFNLFQIFSYISIYCIFILYFAICFHIFLYFPHYPIYFHIFYNIYIYIYNNIQNIIYVGCFLMFSNWFKLILDLFICYLLLLIQGGPPRSINGAERR